MSTLSTDLMVVDSLNGLPLATAKVSVPQDVEVVVFDGADVLARLRQWETDFVAAQSPATVRAVRSDWSQYIRWCERHALSPLPTSVTQLEAYVRNAIVRGRKRATIDRYLYTIDLIHSAAELPRPTAHRAWRLKWRAMTEKELAVRGGNTTRQAAELRTADVDAILRHLAATKMTRYARRDAAMLSLASDTLLRESELVRVCVEHFSQTREGEWRLWVPVSKTNRSGAELDYRRVTPGTIDLINALRAAEGITHGVLFRAISGRPRSSEGRIAQNGALEGGMGPEEVARIFRRRAMQAGLANAANVSGHSTRVGMANDLIALGYSTPQIMDAGKWKSAEMVTLYTRRSGAGEDVVGDAKAKLRGE